MGSLGFSELLLIGIVALLAFGGERLPEAARKAGNAARQIRDILDSAKGELTKAVVEPEKKGPPPPPAASPPA